MYISKLLNVITEEVVSLHVLFPVRGHCFHPPVVLQNTLEGLFELLAPEELLSVTNTHLCPLENLKKEGSEDGFGVRRNTYVHASD